MPKENVEILYACRLFENKAKYYITITNIHNVESRGAK